MIDRATPYRGGPGFRHARSRFPKSLASAGRARAFVSETCEAWHIPGVAMDAALVVTELVENAVRHGKTACDVTLELADEGLLIAARDGSTDEPRVMRPDPARAGGRGMLLIENICCRWGFDIVDGGKRVWAILRVSDVA